MPLTPTWDCDRPVKPEHCFVAYHCTEQEGKQEPKIQAGEVPTALGHAVEKEIERVVLKLEVRWLREEVQALRALMDRDDVAAAARVRAKSPTNAELKLWAEASIPPEHLEREECPW